MADSGRICVVASEWETPLGRLPCVDKWTIDCTGKSARVQAGRDGRNLAPSHGKVRLVGDTAGGQAACGTEQLSGEVEKDIEGGIHLCNSYGHINPKRRNGVFPH